MTWHPVAPDGTKSVKDNRPILGDNTTYTETTMNVDHIWGDSSSGGNQGHHQFVQMPKSDVGGTPTDPSLASLMDGLIYSKELSATESVSNQDVKPFYINEAGATSAVPGVEQIMQLLGIRAMCVFSVDGAGVITETYKHNVTVTRQDTGEFTATFAAELPTNDYLALGSCIRNTSSTSSYGLWVVSPSTTLTSVKSTTELKFATYSNVGALLRFDPLQCWFVIFGG